ncbi:copper-containing nitrite reductase [Purpureocillium lavendulum]|uniref:Copper-containing nitrite reductase n=1 Tax=Purpureocillium lavendulum TaxID=1247861 RepID=A0AB34FCU1_9HYPO|nr:copper-containing nitrite reductase [Purpureocillium lavendulum]
MASLGARWAGPARSRLSRSALGIQDSHAFRSSRLWARPVTSSAKPSGDPNKSRLVPILAASACVAAGAFYLSGQANTRMDLAQDTADVAGKTLRITLSPSSLASTSTSTSTVESRVAFHDALEDNPPDVTALPIEHAVLTAAPHVPPPITRTHEALVKVDLTTAPKVVQVTNQHKYEAWTFNGTVPGPFIRARAGDVVELRLTNRDETGNPHNIDSHAFTGPGGGSALTNADEGEAKTARFRLLCPGLYVYHCAAAPVPVHIAKGMFGLMYVQPADDGDGTDGTMGGLPPVDREYYVMQSEVYHEPPEVDEETGRPSQTVEFSYPQGLREEANAVVFNGREAALTRDAPLKARAGETVRIFFGNAGPNLTSSFHVIGSHFRRVYRDGDVLSPPGRFVGTVGVPPGGATVVDLKAVVPGTYTLVDHAIFRIDKGAVGFLNVAGAARPDVYGSAEPPAPCVGCKLHT